MSDNMSGNEDSDDEQPRRPETLADRKRREQEEARGRLLDEERRKQEEKERKKAEVRARLEQAAQAKKGKKGFMTPERKKKLRTLLRKKAAEELKLEQERKAQQRKKIISERCGPAKAVDSANEAELYTICKEYYERIYKVEDAKWDLELEVKKKEFKINKLNAEVNDLRGKFVKPVLKKVSKYEGKFEKLMAAAKSTDLNFRANLKVVKTNKFQLDEVEKEAKPEWALGKKKEDEGEE